MTRGEPAALVLSCSWCFCVTFDGSFTHPGVAHCLTQALTDFPNEPGQVHRFSCGGSNQLTNFMISEMHISLNPQVVVDSPLPFNSNYGLYPGLPIRADKKVEPVTRILTLFVQVLGYDTHSENTISFRVIKIQKLGLKSAQK